MRADSLPSKYGVGALRARLADESMPWTRPHIESLIEQIETLTKQRDEGWQAFYKLRKTVAEEKYPGMTGTVHAHETFPQLSATEREGLELIQEERVKWAKACACECPACESFFEVVSSLEDAPLLSGSRSQTDDVSVLQGSGVPEKAIADRIPKDIGLRDDHPGECGTVPPSENGNPDETISNKEGQS